MHGEEHQQERQRDDPLWVSDVLPGGAHDITAAREHVLPGLRSHLKDLPVLADSGYQGAGIGVHVGDLTAAALVLIQSEHKMIT